MHEVTAPRLDRSALLTIDVQRDFADPAGRAYVDGTDQVIEPLSSAAEAFRRTERPIVHVVRLYRPDGSNADLCRRRSVSEGDGSVLPGTPGAEIVDELLPGEWDGPLPADRLLEGALHRIGPQEWVMYKPRWGAFFKTPLQEHLNALDVDTLVVGGCNYPNCPRSTVYEGSERDYRIVLIENATSRLYERGITELRDIGVRVWDSDELEAELEEASSPPWLPMLEQLRGFVAKRVPSSHADDVLQDALVRLHESTTELEEVDRVEAWVFTVARRTIADFYRNRERGVSEQTVGTPEDGREDEEWRRENLAPYPGDHDVHEEVLSWLRPMAEELPEKYGRPLVMADFEGYTQQEVADEIGLSLSGAKSRVQRARKKLKQRLRECCELEFGPEGRVEAFRRLGETQSEA